MIIYISLNKQTTLPIFIAKEFSVRRRFSDFEWLRTKLEQQLKVI